MTKFLVIKGVAGLGNRIHTICGALSYADKSNRQVYVDWSDGVYGKKGTNSFYQYFEPIHLQTSRIDPEQINEQGVYPKLFKEKIFERAYDVVRAQSIKNNISFAPVRKLIKKVYGLDFWIAKQESFKWWKFFNSEVIFPYGKNIPKNRKEPTLVYIDFLTNCSLDRFWLSYTFKTDFINKLLDFNGLSKINFSDGIGIHIRATDLRETHIDYGKLATILGVITNKNTIVYLATDDKDVRGCFHQHLGDKTKHNGWDLPDTQKRGLHHVTEKGNEETKRQSTEALFRDILILSQVEKFYPFKGSTLSDFIISYRKHLGKKPYENYWNEAGSPLYLKSKL